MLANIETVLEIFRAHYQDIIVCGLIMVSAIIVAIGLLKPLLFNKIPNKHVRKVALALSSIVSCYLVVFAYFIINGYPFDHYWVASTALAIVCVVVYWFYENTCLRDLIGVVGGIALRKVLQASLFALTEDDVNAVKTELKKTGDELKTHTKQEIKKTVAKAKEDKDLKTL